MQEEVSTMAIPYHEVIGHTHECDVYCVQCASASDSPIFSGEMWGNLEPCKEPPRCGACGEYLAEPDWDNIIDARLDSLAQDLCGNLDPRHDGIEYTVAEVGRDFIGDDVAESAQVFIVHLHGSSDGPPADIAVHEDLDLPDDVSSEWLSDELIDHCETVLRKSGLYDGTTTYWTEYEDNRLLLVAVYE